MLASFQFLFPLPEGLLLPFESFEPFDLYGDILVLRLRCPVAHRVEKLAGFRDVEGILPFQRIELATLGFLDLPLALILPDCGSYTKTVINTAEGERWFCTEA